MPYILPRHKVKSQMLLVSFSFSWGMRIALPQGWFDKECLSLFFRQHLQRVGNAYLLHAGLKTLTTATWGQAMSGKLFSWHGNSSSSWQCDKGRWGVGGQTRNSSFNCGPFEYRISSYIYISVPKSNNAGADGCAVTIASMLHTPLGQTIPTPETFRQR